MSRVLWPSLFPREGRWSAGEFTETRQTARAVRVGEVQVLDTDRGRDGGRGGSPRRTTGGRMRPWSRLTGTVRLCTTCGCSRRTGTGGGASPASSGPPTPWRGKEAHGNGRFQHLAGGGDRRQAANRFRGADSRADPAATITAPVALDLLKGLLGARPSHLLRSTPTGIGADADGSVVADGSPAHHAWSSLKKQHKAGWVIAGELLARKALWLLPAYDRVVRRARGRPPPCWTELRTALRANNGPCTTCSSTSDRSADLPQTVSALRVADVAKWMAHPAPGHLYPRVGAQAAGLPGLWVGTRRRSRVCRAWKGMPLIATARCDCPWAWG